MTDLHAALAELVDEWNGTKSKTARRFRRAAKALLDSHEPSGQVDYEQVYRDLRAGMGALADEWEESAGRGVGTISDAVVDLRDRLASFTPAGRSFALRSCLPSLGEPCGHCHRCVPAPEKEKAAEYQPCGHECNGCPTCDPGLDTGVTSSDGDREGLSDKERVNICCGHVTCQQVVAARLAEVTAERDRLCEELGFMAERGHERLYVRYRQQRDEALAEREEWKRRSAVDEQQSSDALAAWEQEKARAEVLAERLKSCPRHPHWSGIVTDCAFCDRLAEQVAAVEAMLGTHRKGSAYRRGRLVMDTFEICKDCSTFDDDEPEVLINAAAWPCRLSEVRTALADPGSVLADRDAKVAARAWDEGYSCGLGDCGKDRARETVAANPYWQRAAGGEVKQP